jgi:hypothetical protein
LSVRAEHGWCVHEQSAFGDCLVEWEAPDELIVSRRRALFHADRHTLALRPLALFPAGPLRSRLSRVRPLQRLLRFAYYNVVKLPDGALFLSFDCDVAVLRDGRIHRVGGLARKARILRGACAVTAAGDVCFGEYLRNEARSPIRIYRLPAGSDRVEIARTFEAGAIRHVHGIYADPWSDALWCVTGDRPSECRIMFSTDGFRTVELAGSGDESWRCVSLQFTPEAIYYGSDAEFEQNHIYRVDRQTLRREQLTAVDGPVYYSARRNGSLFFGVTAERCPSQSAPVAAIWHVGVDGRCRRILMVEKDAWPVRLFLPGTIHFPAGPGASGDLLFHGVALRGMDNRNFVMSHSSVPHGSP